MRDWVLAGTIFWLLYQAFRHPWVGVMGWTWMSTMNPHSLSWRLTGIPFLAAMGGVTLLGLFLSKERKDFTICRENATLMVFMAWMCITLPFSFYFDGSYVLWNRVMKIDLMVLVSLVLLHSRKHIMMFAWILAGSLAYYGVKGGLFTLMTGGGFRVWGPSGTYIEGNNEIALALIIIIPIMRFLQLTTQNKWIARGLVASMVLCAAAALGSQSRGALLALAAMVTMLWWRGKQKFAIGILLAVLGVALIAFMPDTWTDRMSTMKTYDQDASVNGRFNAWWMAFNLAKSNFFGGGFAVSEAFLFARYAPDPHAVHAAHSIYFMVLGEHGFIGLFIFLLLWYFVWSSAGRMRVEGKKLPQTLWLSHLGGMCQVSLVGYAVGGAFLSLSYYDLPYNILILVVLGCRWMDRKYWLEDGESQPVSPLNKPEGSKLC